MNIGDALMFQRHCERSEAIQPVSTTGLLRRFTPRNDEEKS
jgi:hypothetical protein